MAKSARASVVKRNHRNLRTKVFGPAHDARTARLSAKLQELSAKPRPTEDKVMALDVSAEQETEHPSTNDGGEDMEIDAQGAKMKPVKPQSGKSHSNRKEHRVSKKKEKHSMVFASEKARRNKQQKSKR
ncbi:hypothetical protein A1O1_08483 [Capronia coronata CBS 617.96]|uniref:DUF2423 domain-containing protein n=1 Tax=Capronia coronata CBS 617.96 TaxID=1182541 RepID=W9YDH1_9EURO|nr:uncharacterized protein A1O1_08483 [Capronia coronata CBS 617.96]EXJ80339.1 hypothetical protein A1O1_08483 [Capronia coronata CBS 617.96]